MNINGRGIGGAEDQGSRDEDRAIAGAEYCENARIQDFRTEKACECSNPASRGERLKSYHGPWWIASREGFVSGLPNWNATSFLPSYKPN
ncbi:MAG TPA: hypothetical protein VKD04_14140 [Burkholderiales bacterium]|nr:hypothetical protein [Burkholderiales bacterium]